MIHRMQAPFVPISNPFPRPELYLSHDEIQWARACRRTVGSSKPIAILVTGAITDAVDQGRDKEMWESITRALHPRYCLLQIRVTNRRTIGHVVAMTSDEKKRWRPDRKLAGCEVFENISFRQFASLFSIASLYVGANASGMHLAAAFEVDTVTILPRRFYHTAPANPWRRTRLAWSRAAFLYAHGVLVHE